MSEYPNYPPQIPQYPAPYAAPYSAVPPGQPYQPQYPVGAPVPPPIQQFPFQQSNSSSQGPASVPPSHPPKKNHVPSDQRMKIHTIFMFNLAFNLTHDQLLRFCRQYGDVSQLIFPLVKPGMAFCTFYDLRAAEKAVKEMYGQKLNGRPVKTNFAFKPPPHSKRDPKELCSTILVKSSKGKDSVITFDQIKDIMSAFGELRDAEEVFEDSNTKDKKDMNIDENSNPSGELTSAHIANENNDNPDNHSKELIQGQWIVKYYDLRDAQKCVDTGTVKYLDEELKLEFILDDDMGDESTDPNPPPPPKWMRQQHSHDQRKHDQYDHYDQQYNSQSATSAPAVVQPPPAQVPYGYPSQPYPYMAYPYPQVPYGYPPQPYPPVQPMQPPATISQYPSSDQYLQQLQQQQQLTQQQQLPQIPQPQQPILQQPPAPQSIISPLPPLPPIPPSSQTSQPQGLPNQLTQPNPPTAINPQVPDLPPPPPPPTQPPQVQPTHSLLSVENFNNEPLNQTEKQSEASDLPPAQSNNLPSALSSLMELDSDDAPNDFSNDFDSFDANNKNKNNNSNNGHQGSLSFLD